MSRSVILCNASYQVLTRVSWQDAITAIAKGKAFSIADTDEIIGSPSVEMFKPAIIALTKQSTYNPLGNLEEQIDVEFPSKETVRHRDNFTCCYCGGYGDTIDHIIPRHDGGDSTWDNVVCACQKCNGKKGHTPLITLGWEMLFQPTKPTRGDVLASVISRVKNDQEEVARLLENM